MSSRSVSDIHTRAEGESLYIRYRSDANVIGRIYIRRRLNRLDELNVLC